MQSENQHQPPERKAAPYAQDVKRAGESWQCDFARSVDQGPDAALWVLSEAVQASRRAGRALMAGDLSGAGAAMDRAAIALQAARDSLRGHVP